MSSRAIKNNYVVSPAPHIHTGTGISRIMYTFSIALIPAVIHSISVFGMHTVRVISISVATAIISEALIQRIFKRPVTIYDGSAFLTGLLFAMIMPPSAPWWLIAAGCFTAMLVGKHVFGGIGCSPFNPALIGWAIASLSWKEYLNPTLSMINYDPGYSYFYPLALLKKSGAAAVENLSYMDLFMGNQAGGIGAVPVYLVLAGGLFLILRGAISWIIPFCFIAGTAVTASIFWISDAAKYADPLFHLITGNVVIGAFFFATDYSSSPVNKTAKALFGFGCGFLTVIFRVWSVYPNGVWFAILIMNILNPLLDKIRPAVRGK